MHLPHTEPFSPISGGYPGIRCNCLPMLDRTRPIGDAPVVRSLNHLLSGRLLGLPEAEDGDTVGVREIVGGSKGLGLVVDVFPPRWCRTTHLPGRWLASGSRWTVPALIAASTACRGL